MKQQLEGGPGAQDIEPLSYAELREGLSGVVLRARQPVRSANGIIDVRESFAVQQRRLRDKAGSILVVPIQSQDIILGTLTAINTPDGSDFSDGDMALLASLANHAAIAIERTALLIELQRRATTDGLTRLMNRHSWFEHCQHLIALAERSGRPLSLILLDVDYFKHINDAYGHDVGDMVLQMMSETLKKVVRLSDAICRYGGEEFAILLPDTDTDTAVQIAERIRLTIADRPFLILTDSRQLMVTASLGVATMQQKHLNLAELVTIADKALYDAKHAGRNCVRPGVVARFTTS